VHNLPEIELTGDALVWRENSHYDSVCMHARVCTY